MYTPNSPIDRPHHIATAVLDQLTAIDTLSEIGASDDYQGDNDTIIRVAAIRDLHHAIEMLRDLRGNDEITILRKIAFGVRVYNTWRSYATYGKGVQVTGYQF